MNCVGMGRRVEIPPPRFLFDFPATFLPVSFAGKRLLDPELLTKLQIKGMTFHFLDDVLLLYLSLEAAKRVFEGLALLQSDFSQTDYTPQLVPKWTV